MQITKFKLVFVAYFWVGLSLTQSETTKIIFLSTCLLLHKNIEPPNDTHVRQWLCVNSREILALCLRTGKSLMSMLQTIVISMVESSYCVELLSYQPRVTVASCFVYKVIMDLLSIDHLCINPIRRKGLIHMWAIDSRRIKWISKYFTQQL